MSILQNPYGFPVSETFSEPYSEAAIKYLERSKSPNTVKAYKSDWSDFVHWCKDHKESPLPASPKTVVNYLSELAEGYLCANTISRRLTAISEAHRLAKQMPPILHPDVRAVMTGIRKTKGTHQQGKAAILFDDLQDIQFSFPDNLTGLRNRALILLGFSGAFRRSELVSLNVEHLTFMSQGLQIFLARSKSDAEGKGSYLGINALRTSAYCPVAAVRAWLKAGGLKSGPLFRPISKAGTISERRLTDRSVANIVKEWALINGLDPDIYSGHSLRRGFATSAAISGASTKEIMKQTRHRSEKMANRYIAEGTIFERNGWERLE